MGSGKTEWAIHYMNENYNKKFIYVTPYNDEIKDRIIPQCQALGFEFASEGKKLEILKKQLASGKNIVATHECFKMCDEEILDTLKCYNYTLIIDEVMDVVIEKKLAKKDVDNLLHNYAHLDEKNYLIWDDEEYPDSGGVFSWAKSLAKMKNLLFFDDKIILWLFPHQIFAEFENVFILTYLFPGQIQRYYFDLNNIEYKYTKVAGTFGNYHLVQHDGKYHNNLKSLINIYDGVLNDIGKHNTDLSVSWFKNDRKRSKANKTKILKNHINTYLRSNIKAKAKTIIWTTFKDYKDSLSGDGYKNSFASCNLRATNKFRTTNTVVYALNRFMIPTVKNDYFGVNGIRINETVWALSEMLQFIWRSAIRDGNAINLYVPSKRMRELLKKYLNNEFEIN